MCPSTVLYATTAHRGVDWQPDHYGLHSGGSRLVGMLTARGFEPLYGRVSDLARLQCFWVWPLYGGESHLRRPPVDAREHLDIPMSVVPASNQPGVSFEAAIAQHRRSIELFKPTILCATPSMAFALWEEGLLEGFEAVITGGEPSSAALRELLKGLGERMVVEVYGLSEIIGPGVAQSCREGGLHLNEDAFGVEFLEGELVLSTRHNEAMPRGRYRTGDAVTPVSCSCGNMHQAIEVHGRDEDFIEALGLYLSQLEDILLIAWLRAVLSGDRPSALRGAVTGDVTTSVTCDAARGASRDAWYPSPESWQKQPNAAVHHGQKGDGYGSGLKAVAGMA